MEKTTEKRTKKQRKRARRVTRIWQQYIGDRIRLYRFKQELTLAQLEAKSGVDASVIDDYEHAQGDMQLGALVAIAHALELTPIKIIAGWKAP